LIYNILELKENEILSNIKDNSENYSIEFFNSELGAKNSDFQERVKLPLLITSQETTVWVKLIDNRTGCFSLSSFSSQLFEAPNPVGIPDLELCDDGLVDNDEQNGVLYDFSLVDLDNDILADQNNKNDFNVSYHLSQEDADSGNNALDKQSFNNESSPGNISIFVRVENKEQGLCSSSSISFDFNVNTIPFINQNIPPEIGCDLAGTNSFGFNLNALKFKITENTSLHPYIEYFRSEQSVKNIGSKDGLIPEDLLENYEVSSRVIWARLSLNGCYRFTSIELRVEPLPVYEKPMDIEVCEDGSDIDLSSFDLEVIADENIRSGLEISYYPSQADAENQINQLENVNTLDVAGSMDIFISVKNRETGCFSTDYKYFTISSNPLPDFDITTPIVFCQENEQIKVFIDKETDDSYIYEWLDPDGMIVPGLNARSSEVLLSKSGSYLVRATNPDTGCYYEKIYEAYVSRIAEIGSEDIVILDENGNKSVRIKKEGLGIGDYEFSIDDINGPYQSEGYFDQLNIGTHVIYIRDIFGCGIAEVTVTILDFPKYFTPEENDNSTWNVRGVSNADAELFSKGEINIFNRYGQQITTINIYGEGWDGTWNGVEMLPTDYWYSAKLIDQNGEIRMYQGHFSLIK
jgi:gliding motility-associated-like protein